jgi:hypothetical protein
VDTTAEPIPVAEQKAAGVPPEETVTMADQRQGADVHPAALSDTAAVDDSLTVEKTEEPAPEPPAVQMLPTSAANESPILPPSAVVSAAHAHAALDHLKAVANAIQADIERWVPQDVLHNARNEMALVIRQILG